MPLACHADDVDAMEGKRPMQEAAASNVVNRVIRAIWQGPPYRVDRVLREGDEVAGFRVVPRPGARPRRGDLLPRADRVAICGDVIRNMSYATGAARDQGAAGDLHLRPGREPPLDPQARRPRIPR